MTTTATDLASLRAFRADWSAASVEEDLRRWSAFLTEQGVSWSLDAKDRDFVDQVIGSGAARPGVGIEMRLSKLANDALASAGDARRVGKLVTAAPGGAPGSHWYLISPEQRRALAESGHRFEVGMEGALRGLATIPITLGVYFGAQYACRQAGLDANVAWIVALVAYVLTVRVVRGRWPLQAR